jgi:hypothetical protein
MRILVPAYIDGRSSIKALKASRMRSLPAILFDMEVPSSLDRHCAKPGWYSAPERVHVLLNFQQI